MVSITQRGQLPNHPHFLVSNSSNLTAINLNYLSNRQNFLTAANLKTEIKYQIRLQQDGVT